MLDLPRLTLTPPVACSICGGRALRAIGHRDFGDSCNDAFAGSRTFPIQGVDISYHRCETCAFTVTSALDAWAPDDYRRFIYNDDYLAADPPFALERPLRNARMIADRWRDEKSTLRVLDYGAGSGVMAVELARLGVNCDSCDPFYGEPPKPQRYPVVTCFEVIEHVPHSAQLGWFEELVAHVEPGGLLLMSTVLLEQETPIDHYYIGPRNGHVSIHSDASLRRLAARENLELTSSNGDLHVLRRPR